MGSELYVINPIVVYLRQETTTSMKKFYVIALTFFIASVNQAQILFEKGYFIDYRNARIDCLIRNVDWKNNPEKFDYKLSEDTEIKTINIKETKEFGIGSTLKLVRFRVGIDRSSDNINKLTYNRLPEFKQEDIFLKVILEGKATLYSYSSDAIERFFFSIDSIKPQQLVYKSYKTNDDKIGKNNTYKQQIFEKLSCGNIQVKDIDKIGYNRTDLTKIFTAYNQCESGSSITYEEKTKKDLFNLSIRPRYNISSLSINQRVSDFRDADFGTKSQFSIGLEAEIILPFNKNKWAITIEPTYNSFNAKETTVNQSVTIDYKSISVPFGVRHYFYLSTNSQLFINGLYILNFDLNSVFDYEHTLDYEVDSRNNLALGIGFKYKNRFIIELREALKTDLLGNSYWDADYKQSSIIVGYTLF